MEILNLSTINKTLCAFYLLIKKYMSMENLSYDIFFTFSIRINYIYFGICRYIIPNIYVYFITTQITKFINIWLISFSIATA